jgi:carbon storage regulator CsrA
MLILTNKPQETIVIGCDTKVPILEINDSQVCIGIDAPKIQKIYQLKSGVSFTYEEMECIDGFLRSHKRGELAAALGLSRSALTQLFKLMKRKLYVATDHAFADRLIDAGYFSSGFRSKIWGEKK